MWSRKNGKVDPRGLADPAFFRFVIGFGIFERDGGILRTPRSRTFGISGGGKRNRIHRAEGRCCGVMFMESVAHGPLVGEGDEDVRCGWKQVSREWLLRFQGYRIHVVG